MEESLSKQLVIGVGVLLAVAALIGTLVAVVTLKVADVAGLDDTAPARHTGPPKGLGPVKNPTTSGPTQSTGTAGPNGPSTTHTTPPQRAIVLTASPRSTGTYQRITLAGTFAGGNGHRLDVQRKEGGAWVGFPTSASVDGGRFSTYVETGRTGNNVFRVADTASDRVSNTVTVVVR